MTCSPKEITIDGTTFIPKSCKPTGNRQVVVLDRGWIFAGDVTRANGRILITRAVHVFSWQENGFSGMVEDPAKAKAKLVPMKQDVDVPEGSEIFSVPVHEKWGL